jgi:hypothetical protein
VDASGLSDYYYKYPGGGAVRALRGCTCLKELVEKILENVEKVTSEDGPFGLVDFVFGSTVADASVTDAASLAAELALLSQMAMLMVTEMAWSPP